MLAGARLPVCKPFVDAVLVAGTGRAQATRWCHSLPPPPPRPSPVNKTELFLSGLFLFLSKLELHPRAQAGRGREEGAARVGADAETDKNPLKKIIIIMIMSEEFAVT